MIEKVTRHECEQALKDFTGVVMRSPATMKLDKIEGNKMYHTNWMDGIFPETYEQNRFYRKQVVK